MIRSAGKRPQTGDRMIQVTFYREKTGEYTGFRMEGHAEFAAYGNDIVCAGVSALVINTINSIEAFADDACIQKIHQEKDVVSFAVTSRPVSREAELLLRSLVMGVESVAKEYGKKYIRVKTKKNKEG